MFFFTVIISVMNVYISECIILIINFTTKFFSCFTVEKKMTKKQKQLNLIIFEFPLKKKMYQ